MSHGTWASLASMYVHKSTLKPHSSNTRCTWPSIPGSNPPLMHLSHGTHLWPGKQKTQTQCCIIVGPASTTLAQHQTSIGWGLVFVVSLDPAFCVHSSDQMVPGKAARFSLLQLFLQHVRNGQYDPPPPSTEVVGGGGGLCHDDHLLFTGTTSTQGRPRH